MVNRLVSVGDDFTLPTAVKVADTNLPTRLGAAALNATYLNGSNVTYVPKGWGQFWKPKRDASGSSLARVAVVGDSISQGFDASNIYTKSYAHLIRAALQTSNGDGGSGFLGCAHSSVWAQYEVPGYTAQFRVTTTGSWITQTPENNGALGSGPGAVNLYSSTVGNTITFNQVRGTSIEVFYGTYSGNGTFNVTIDGAAVAPINTNVAGPDTKVASYAVAAGSHTVVLTVGTAANCILYGVRGSNTTGVRLDSYARSAGDTRTFIAETSGGGQGAPWSGGNKNPTDLLIYAMGVNDAANANLSGDAYIDNIRKHLDQVKDGGTADGSTDILFFHPHVGNWDNTGNYKYHQYTERVRNLAESYGAAYVNAWADGRNSYNRYKNLNYWGPGHTATGIPGNDAVHPGDLGHQHYADLLLPIITAP